MPASGTAVIDFGAFPGANEASIAVTGQAAIVAGSKVDAWITSVVLGAHTVNDHAYAAMLAGITCSVPTAATGFTIYARSAEKLQGSFNIQWAWS